MWQTYCTRMCRCRSCRCYFDCIYCKCTDTWTVMNQLWHILHVHVFYYMQGSLTHEVSYLFSAISFYSSKHFFRLVLKLSLYIITCNLHVHVHVCTVGCGAKKSAYMVVHVYCNKGTPITRDSGCNWTTTELFPKCFWLSTTDKWWK